MKKKHPLYQTWRGIYRRFKGGMVDLDNKWLSFDVFCKDVGPKPSKYYVLARKDSSLPYQSGNVHWASKRSTGKIIEFNGIKLSIRQWAKRLGISASTISNRLKSNWNIEKALSSNKHLKWSVIVTIDGKILNKKSYSATSFRACWDYVSQCVLLSRKKKISCKISIVDEKGDSVLFTEIFH